MCQCEGWRNAGCVECGLCRLRETMADGPYAGMWHGIETEGDPGIDLGYHKPSERMFDGRPYLPKLQG